jgi:hypothetical protein
LTPNLYIGECGDADHIQPVKGQKTPGDCGSFDGLVYGPGSDGLDLGAPLFTDNPGDGAGDRCGL